MQKDPTLFFIFMRLNNTHGDRQSTGHVFNYFEVFYFFGVTPGTAVVLAVPTKDVYGPQLDFTLGSAAPS